MLEPHFTNTESLCTALAGGGGESGGFQIDREFLPCGSTCGKERVPGRVFARGLSVPVVGDSTYGGFLAPTSLPA